MTDRLKEIFVHQEALMIRFKEIERNNGFHLNCPDLSVDIDDSFGQARLKDTAWRIVEELGEALQASKDNDKELHTDEISDVLHFLVELCILANYRPDMIPTKDFGLDADILDQWFMSAKSRDDEYSIPELYGNDNYSAHVIATGLMVESLAMACNTLKNKPWKQSLKRTDRSLWQMRIQETWMRFSDLCIVSGLGPDDLYQAYLKKAAVNAERQRSGV